MTPFFILFGCWLAGMVILYLWLWNQNKSLTVDDVFITYILGGVIGLVFAFAGWKANVSHWVIWIAFAAIAFIITNKLLNYKQ
jgi:hypothetical protein